jgi:hypothetical protein
VETFDEFLFVLQAHLQDLEDKALYDRWTQGVFKNPSS